MAHQNRRVVVVDPDQKNADALVALLSVCECDAVRADNPDAVLALVSRVRPQLIFIAIAFHPNDAFLLASLVRTNFSGEHLKIIGISSLADDPTTYRRARRAGFDHVLLEPFGLVELTSVLRA